MKRWIGIGVPFLIVLSLVGWRVVAEKEGAAKIKEGQKSRTGSAPVVEVATAASRPIVKSIEAVGNLEAPFVVRLSPKIAGRIEYLEVREGDEVQPGQALIRIDPTELDAQLLQQQAQVSEARSRLAQAQMTQGATDANVQSAVKVQSAAVTSAEADFRQVERNYDAIVSASESRVNEAKASVSSKQAIVRQRSSELNAAKASAKNAKARMDRAETLVKKGFISDQQAEDARTAYENAQAQVIVAENQVSSAESDVNSARAQQTTAEKELSVAKEKGKADIAAARARVVQAKALQEQAVANKAQSPAYRENLKALQASVEAAEAGLRQLSARRSDTVLSSPIAGTVTERTADPGTLASPGQAIVTVQYLKWLYVDAAIPVDSSAQVYSGQAVQIRLDAFPNRKFTGKIEKINRSADPQSRQFNVKMRLDNPKEELRPGMFARISIVTETVRPPVVVPISAISRGRDGESVMVLDANNKATKRMVKTGLSDQQGIGIEAGLKPGDRVVTLSYAPIREGQQVKVAGGKSDKGAGD